MNRGIVSLVAIVVIAWLVITLQSRQTEQYKQASFTIQEFLVADDSAVYREVTPDRVLEFPKDHGAHPDFRQEWWYFTGVFETENGDQKGFQLTFFRFAGQQLEVQPDSQWHSNQSWMAHFAISDVANQQFYSAEDFSRGTLGLAGATPSPLKIWTNSWLVQEGNGDCDSCLVLNLKAATTEFAVDLSLETDQAPILQGDRGFSVKNPATGNASYYYSYPEFGSSGIFTIADTEYHVKGHVWMDHEWSSGVLAKNQTGWDWFGLRFREGGSLMAFRLRDENEQHYHYALFVDPQGNQVVFKSSEISMVSDQIWQSPKTGSKYPQRWRLNLQNDERSLSLTVDSLIPDQEHSDSFNYYEGLVSVSGKLDGQSMSGEGYMELTGY